MKSVPLALALAAAGSSGCTPAATAAALEVSTPRPPAAWPSQPEWTEARARLAALRVTAPGVPYTEVVNVTMRDPRSGRTLQARGAVAVAPHRALRMILLGPGGSTALDVWATPDRWRLAVPPLGLLRRGAAEADPALPIGFFRWWFLAPLDGRLLDGRATSTSAFYVLRADRTTVTVWSEGGTDGEGEARLRLRAVRREGGQRIDRLAWSGRSLRPAAEDRATYEQLRSGLLVEVGVESVSDGPPEDAAFEDPDGAQGRQ